jgi:hypothetical protein
VLLPALAHFLLKPRAQAAAAPASASTAFHLRTSP